MDSLGMIDISSTLFQFTGVGLIVQSELFLRIIVATFLGLLIGNERKNRNKMAGVRTHAIVALGSALMMIVSKYGFGDVAKVDAARLAAQVVTGVGFLGAGIIFVRNNMVNGLTTAAGIWATAGIGLALGAGQYVLGIATGVLIVFVQTILHKLSCFSGTVLAGTLHLTIVQQPGAVENMRKYLVSEKLDVAGIKITKNKKGEIKIEFDVLYPPKYDRASFLSRLVEKEEVLSVTE